MVKRLSVISVLLSIGCAFATPVTNVSQILNVSLDSGVLNGIITDASTPDRLYLSFVKATAVSDLPLFLSLFDNDYAMAEYGMCSTNALPQNQILDFARFVGGGGVTNRIVESYSSSVTNEIANISSLVKLYTRFGTMDETCKLMMRRVNNEWKIYRWNE